MRKAKWWWVLIGGVLGLGAAAALGFGSLKRAAGRPQDPPYPPLRAHMSPADLSRGETLFRAVCLACHGPGGAERASGGRMAELPPFFGEVNSANLTADPNAGVGRMSDAAIARAVRYGVMHDGRVSVMPALSMGDRDLEAVIGFMRSGNALFSPDPRVVPPSRPTDIGRIIFFMSHGGGRPSSVPPSGVPTPIPAPTAEYGAYIALSIYGCADCHTPGFSPDKVQGEEAFAGGFTFQGADGKEIRSANLTFDGTGLYLWTYPEFLLAVRDGIRPDGTAVVYPMPHFRVPEVEIRALWEYLRVVPRRASHFERERPVDWSRRRPLRETAEAGGSFALGEEAEEANTPVPPNELFVQLGCPACHAPGARFHDRIVAGRTKPAKELAEWIRHPERVKPGTMMPTFASQLSEPVAIQLADWLRKTPPDKLPRGK